MISVFFITEIEGLRVYFSLDKSQLHAFTGNEFTRPVFLFGILVGYLGSTSMVNWKNMPVVKVPFELIYPISI